MSVWKAVSLTLAAALFSSGQASAGFYVPPGGSYQLSCAGIHTQGRFAVAWCRRNDGRMHHTSLFLPDCPSNSASNLDGWLVCDR